MFVIDGAEGHLDRRATPFRGVSFPSAIDKNPTHHLRSDREELRAALPRHARLAVQPHPRLVHERRCLERLTLAFTAQRAARLSPQIVVDESRERLTRLRITRAPPLQELGHLVKVVRLA